MTISFGSAQTGGMPVRVTAVSLATAQLLHTAPVGAATPDLVKVRLAFSDYAVPFACAYAFEDDLLDSGPAGIDLTGVGISGADYSVDVP